MLKKKIKLKTNKSAAKRFEVTAGGIKRRYANHNHILTKKSKKRKARLERMTVVNRRDEKNIYNLLHKKNNKQ